MKTQKPKRTLMETVQKVVWHSTSAIRPYPDFLITGVAKAGTESLWAAMMQHPQIMKPNTHSVHYFDDLYYKGDDWYKAHFPICRKLKPQSIVGEKSTFYLSHPYSAQRIHATMPNAKLIIMLRNPVDRAISQYFHYKNRGHESLTIEEAFDQEGARLQPYLSSMDSDTTYKAAHPFKVCSYKMRGHYAEQIERYFKYFNKDQIKIIRSETFFETPEIVLQDLFQFLGVSADVKINDLKPVNIGAKKDTVPDSVYDDLYAYFKPYNEDLKRLIGDEFTW